MAIITESFIYVYVMINLWHNYFENLTILNFPFFGPFDYIKWICVYSIVASNLKRIMQPNSGLNSVNWIRPEFFS